MSDWTDVKNWATDKAAGPYDYGIGQRVLALIAENEALTATGKILGSGVDILGPRCDQLKAENEQSRATSQYWKDEHLAANVVIDQLKAEIEALRKNSDRYLFLRNEVSSHVRDFCIVAKYWGGTFPDRILVLEGADAEIDAAMGKGEQS